MVWDLLSKVTLPTTCSHHMFPPQTLKKATSHQYSVAHTKVNGDGEKVNAVRFEGEQATLCERATVIKASATVDSQDFFAVNTLQQGEGGDSQVRNRLARGIAALT